MGDYIECSDDNIAACNQVAAFGPIGTWDTSCIKNFFQLFYNKGTFNEDINAWDTSSGKSALVFIRHVNCVFVFHVTCL